MPIWLKTGSADFDSGFRDFLVSRQNINPDVQKIVTEIIAEIRKEGDAALIKSAKNFDGVSLTADRLRLPPQDIKKIAERCPQSIRNALDLAAERIEAWHKKQFPQDFSFTDAHGVKLGWRWRALDSVGLYIPGGSARYPSSVLMSALPAKLAGCRRIAAATPAHAVNDPLLMAALLRAGIDEVWLMGGASAIAAFAYGTQTIQPVDKITGPGNAYVAEAKRQVFGDVGIDMVAGPSEILIIADAHNDPEWIAADLLSQAEHDASAQSILITDDESLAEKTSHAVSAQIKSLPRADIAAESWQKHGAIIIAENISDAAQLANQIAAEHVELLTQNAADLANSIHHAGTIFLGPHTPEVLGDYVLGSNHILPTARTARFASGLSLSDFMKRSSILHCPQTGFKNLAEAAIILAEAEGLQAHARAAAIRLGKNKPV